MLLRSSSTSMLNSMVDPEFSAKATDHHFKPSKPNISFKKMTTESDPTTNYSCMHHRAAEVAAGGGGGGNRYGGGGGGGDDGSWYWDANHSSMDVYYESMMQANPGNHMILSNYATFLKEIRGDLVKAEEYLGRAILANPNCGDVLSVYGDLIWEMYRDANRAHLYFDRALKDKEASSHNSYVMASYARFLWDAEDELIEEDQQQL